MLTKHAARRLRQRGIRYEVIDLLLAYGRSKHDHHGAEVIYFDHRARRILERQRGLKRLSIEANLLGCYIVMGSAGQILTVGHRTRRMRME